MTTSGSCQSSAVMRVGYWMTERKLKKLRFNEFIEVCRQNNVEVVKLDLSRSIELQGPLDAIIHKLSDDVVNGAENGDEYARKCFKNFQNYLTTHPRLVVLDRLSSVLQLMDRNTMFSVLQESLTNSKRSKQIFVPAFVEFTSRDVAANFQLMKSKNVNFPCVCKPALADGTDTSHQMMIVFSRAGLGDVEVPCVAQSLINHDGILHKLFVVGRRHFLVRRPSLKNLQPGDFATEKFHTRDVSKSQSDSHLNEMTLSRDSPSADPCPEMLEDIAMTLSTQLDLHLFGVDVIVDAETGNYGVIDVNAFPGYDGVADFANILFDHVVEEVEKSSHNSELSGKEMQQNGNS